MLPRLTVFARGRRGAGFNDVIDKKLSEDLSRADDDGLAFVETDLERQATDQDSDCWSNLWESIKTQVSRFFRRS